jgi:UDP:flavonoid glycosyltransferase YjiC (YdhE family)
MGSISPSNIHVVLLALPAFGHVRPAVVLAHQLLELNYTVTVVSGTTFRGRIEAIKGVEFVPLKGKANADFDVPLTERFPDRPKENTILFDMEKVFYDAFVEQFETVKEVIERQDLRNRRVVIVQDGCKFHPKATDCPLGADADTTSAFVGTMPIALESTEVRRVPIIGLGHFPLGILSEDTAPFNSGLPSQGKEANKKMNEGAMQMFAGITALEQRLIEPYNCKRPLPSKFMLTNWVLICDIYCQLCVPALEPPRSDLPTNLRFCGALTGYNDPSRGKKPHPEWFEDFVTADDTKRPLILVSSGSLPGQNVNHLILPTIEACKDLPVRVVVCAVHVERPAGELPENVRWAQWIPFEDIFPHTSLVISSGGYGALSQAFANGIPMILAGMTEDKQHNGMLGEATGAAINLKTQTPSVEQVRDAVLEIQNNASYKREAEELRKAYADCDPVGSIVEAIEEVAAKFFGQDGV